MANQTPIDGGFTTDAYFEKMVGSSRDFIMNHNRDRHARADPVPRLSGCPGAREIIVIDAATWYPLVIVDFIHKEKWLIYDHTAKAVCIFPLLREPQDRLTIADMKDPEKSASLHEDQNDLWLSFVSKPQPDCFANSATFRGLAIYLLANKFPDPADLPRWINVEDWRMHWALQWKQYEEDSGSEDESEEDDNSMQGVVSPSRE